MEYGTSLHTLYCIKKVTKTSGTVLLIYVLTQFLYSFVCFFCNQNKWTHWSNDIFVCRWMFSLKGWSSVSFLYLNWRNITCSTRPMVVLWRIWPSSPELDYQFNLLLQVFIYKYITHTKLTPVLSICTFTITFIHFTDNFILNDLQMRACKHVK